MTDLEREIRDLLDKQSEGQPSMSRKYTFALYMLDCLFTFNRAQESSPEDLSEAQKDCLTLLDKYKSEKASVPIADYLKKCIEAFNAISPKSETPETVSESTGEALYERGCSGSFSSVSEVMDREG